MRPGTDAARRFHLLLHHRSQYFHFGTSISDVCGQSGFRTSSEAQDHSLSSYDSSSGPLLQELGWDGLSIRRIKLVVIEVFKVQQYVATEYVCQTFLKMRSTCNTRGSSSRFQLPLAKTNYGKNVLISVETGACRKGQWLGQCGGIVYFYLRFLRLKTAQITIRSPSRPFLI